MISNIPGRYTTQAETLPSPSASQGEGLLRTRSLEGPSLMTFSIASDCGPSSK